MSLKIAFFADTHLGYRARCRDDARGINLRAADGHRALRETIEQIVDGPDKIDVAIHGGDLFHGSHPDIRDIALAQHYLRELSRNDIPFYGVAGNHDASDNRSSVPAVAAVNDPDRGIYAMHKPYEKFEISPGVWLHAVPHHGLSGEEAPVVVPDAQGLNIFTTHGAAVDPRNATLMRCLDSPREQIIPPEMILDEHFAMRLLGHYHSRYAVGGEALNTWYAGSALRRGFSDEAGRRGWLLITLNPDGTHSVETRDIFQRPQYDLDVIDANGLSGSDVQELIEQNLAGTRRDEIGSQFDEINAPIVRQRVINAGRAVREGIDRSRIQSLAAHCLTWQLNFERPETVAIQQVSAELAADGESTVETLGSSSLKGDILEQFGEWSPASSSIQTLPDDLKERVLKGAQKHLQTVAHQDAH